MKILKYRLRDQRGVVFVMVIIALLVLLAFAALALDVGNVLVVRNELQNIADGAALAGARTLGRLYECNGDIVACPNPMPYPTQLTYVADASVIKQACKDVASVNKAGDKTGIILNDADIVIGNWNLTTKTVNPITLTSPDAVRVTARRDTSANSPISTFFARIRGINTVGVSATATAALTGESTIARGGLPFPVAINKSWMSTLPCNQDLTFHPSSAGVCAAWHAYDAADYQPTGNGERDLIDALRTQTYSSPETIAGQTFFVFTNGTLATVFSNTHNQIQDLFNTMKVKDDGKLDRDLDPATWTTGIPIFDDSVDGCSPNGPVKIVGFTAIIITRVDGPPTNTIFARVLCDDVVEGRGSGGNYGTKGSIPGLVQ